MVLDIDSKVYIQLGSGQCTPVLVILALYIIELYFRFRYNMPSLKIEMQNYFCD